MAWIFCLHASIFIFMRMRRQVTSCGCAWQWTLRCSYNAVVQIVVAAGLLWLYCRAAAKPSRYSSVAAATNSMTNQTQWWCNYYLSIFMCFHFHRRSSGENKKIRLLAKNTHNTTLCAGYLLFFVFLLIMQAKNPNLAVRTNCCILVFMFFGWRILHWSHTKIKSLTNNKQKNEYEKTIVGCSFICRRHRNLAIFLFAFFFSSFLLLAFHCLCAQQHNKQAHNCYNTKQS